MSDELPQGWTTVELENHVYIAGRIGWRGLKRSEYTKTGPRFLAVKNILPNGQIDFAETDHLSQERYDESPEIQVKRNDILLTKDGTIGKVGMIDSLPGPTTVNSSILVVRPNDELFLDRYLFHYLRGPQFQGIAHERITGSAIPHLFQKDIKKLRALVPPVNEQQRIVAKLEKLLGKVDACQQRLTKIPVLFKRFRQSVLAAACSGRLTADWREENSNAEAQDQVGEGEPPENIEIPSSWGWLLSTHAFDFVTSGSRGWARYYADDGPIFLRVGNLDHDSIQLDLTSIQRVQPPSNAEGRRTRIQQGDLLISVTADVGMVALVETDIGEAYINQHVALARPNGNLDSRYLAYFLSARNGGQQQFVNLQRGATKAGLGLDDIKSIWVARPPLAEQQEIVRRVEAFFALADQIEARYAKAKAHVEKLTQSILSKAFRGELVPQNPNDESATELLNRIAGDSSSRKRKRVATDGHER